MDGNAIMMLIAAVLILVSAVLFFLTIFLGKFKKPSVKEKALEAVTDCSEGEFRLKIAKHMKETESAQKEMVEALKTQNAFLQTQINSLKNEIYNLSEKQVNQTKSIIKYNKENARQLAISERETLEYVMLELKKAVEDNAGAVAAPTAPALEAAPVFEAAPALETAPVFEEVSGEELFEVNDLPADEDLVLPDFPETESTDDFDLSALFDDLAEGAMAEEVVPAEETVPVVEEKAEDPMAGFGSDPNAMMTPEEIAKLLEAMGQ